MTGHGDGPSRLRLVATMSVLALVLVAVAFVVDTVTGDGTDADGGPPAGSDRTPTSTASGAARDGSDGGAGRSDDAGASPASTTEPACQAMATISSWPLRRRLAALVVVGVDPVDLTSVEAAAAHHVGGVFVGGDSPHLLQSGLLQRLQAAAPTGLLVAVDEEGGRVQRIDALDGEVPSARAMAATMTVDEVRALAERRGTVMAAHGITVDMAPVLDVSDQPDGSVIGDRSWSSDPAVVSTYARAYAEGLLSAGVAPVLKHFPGHGQASGDTHETAATTASLDVLRGRDLLPYQDLLPVLGERVGVMLGHLDVPGLTEPGRPASLSPATVSLLRDNYGFDGVVLTDDLAGMASITDRFTPADAAVAALAAGVDQVLLASTDLVVLLDRLEQAVAAGALDPRSIDSSVARVLRWKGLDPCEVAI